MPADEKIRRRIERALIKKAVGYSARETVKEYQISDGEEILIKKKVSDKAVPPDINAAKMLLEAFENCDLAAMSDEALEKEKQRLLTLLERS